MSDDDNIAEMREKIENKEEGLNEELSRLGESAIIVGGLCDQPFEVEDRLMFFIQARRGCIILIGWSSRSQSCLPVNRSVNIKGMRTLTALNLATTTTKI